MCGAGGTTDLGAVTESERSAWTGTSLIGFGRAGVRTPRARYPTPQFAVFGVLAERILFSHRHIPTHSSRSTEHCATSHVPRPTLACTTRVCTIHSRAQDYGFLCLYLILCASSIIMCRTTPTRPFHKCRIQHYHGIDRKRREPRLLYRRKSMAHVQSIGLLAAALRFS